MENPEIAQVFDEVADLLEIQNANPFRVRAYRNAARTIRDLSEPLAGISENKLTELAGIGNDLAGKIMTILNTGDLPLRRELERETPAGLRELMRVPGLGPKKARALFELLKIQSLDELRAAAEQHQIRKLRGFGVKTEENILKALGHIEQLSRRVLFAEAKVFADAVVRHLKTAPGVGHVDLAGSFRRCKETVGDLDLLATCKDADAVMDHLAKFDAVSEVMARGPTKMTVRLRCGLQLDLRIVPEESYGAALQYFTGSKEHSIALRRRAMDLGLKINEYGVFRGNQRVAGRTEEEVYRAVGLPWIAPELRENRGELAMALEGRLPKLIELDDIRGDLHMHTTATDGRASLQEMVAAAKKHGYEYIAITDHSKRVTMARGLDDRRLRLHWNEIGELNLKVKGINVLKGVEVDILENGSLDLPDEILAEADWVIASIHYGQSQSREQMTKRLLNAIRNPHVDAIGHLSGRLIGRRKGMEMDLGAVLQAAADHGCLLEVNSQPDRLDLDDTTLLAAKERGVRFVINTDAHSVEELSNMQYGVCQARRAGLEANDVVNTQSLASFLQI